MEISVKKTAARFGRILCTTSLLLSFLPSCRHSPELKVPYYTDATFTPLWDAADIAKNKDHRIAAFSFTDQYGQNFTNKNVTGKIYVANFFFTSCKGICPKMLGNMNKVYRHFSGNNDVFFLSHSVTPEMDSVPALRQYALDNDITGTQWRLLTGKADVIYRMARQSYFAEEAAGLSKDSTEFLYTENLVLIDRNSRIRGLYNGTLATEVPRMIADIDALLEER